MAKEIAIAVNPEKDCLEVLKSFKHKGLFEGARVHFVFIFEVQYYFNELTTYVFPTEEQKDSIKQNFLDIVENVKNDILGEAKPKEVVHQCLFAYDPKEKMVEYVESHHCDLAIVATRNKSKLESLFTSSFAEHMIKLSTSDVLVVRP